MEQAPSLSTDQVAAFVALARRGSLRRAAAVLHITEQGVRNRLIGLERRLGVELYRKQRGMRRQTALTEQGRRLLPEAQALLEQANDLCHLFDGSVATHDVHVAASNYLAYYVLIDLIRRFHAAHPNIRIRLSTRTEREIEISLLQGEQVSMGIIAPYEPGLDLEFTPLFATGWSLLAPTRHPLLKRPRPLLRDIVDQPLIVFERGSSGRHHVLDAFHQRNLSPRIDMEVTSTPIIVRMVEARMGVAIVSPLPGGGATKGRRVVIRSLGSQIRPLQTGILTRRGERPSPAAREFINFIRAAIGGATRSPPGRSR